MYIVSVRVIMTKNQQLEQTLKANKGFITSREAREAGIATFSLLSFTRKEGMIRVDRGFYARKNWDIDEYLVFQRRYSKFIFSYESALYLWNLTDKIVSNLVVTGPYGYHPYSNKRSDVETHLERDPSIYKLGIVSVKTIFGNEVFAYDKEKTICDIINRREEMESETFVKALRFYEEAKDKDPQKLMKYAKSMGIEKAVSDIMEIIGKV